MFLSLLISIGYSSGNQLQLSETNLLIQQTFARMRANLTVDLQKKQAVARQEFCDQENLHRTLVMEESEKFLADLARWQLFEKEILYRNQLMSIESEALLNLFKGNCAADIAARAANERARQLEDLASQERAQVAYVREELQRTRQAASQQEAELAYALRYVDLVSGLEAELGQARGEAERARELKGELDQIRDDAAWHEARARALEGELDQIRSEAAKHAGRARELEAQLDRIGDEADRAKMLEDRAHMADTLALRAAELEAELAQVRGEAERAQQAVIEAEQAAQERAQQKAIDDEEIAQVLADKERQYSLLFTLARTAKRHYVNLQEAFNATLVNSDTLHLVANQALDVIGDFSGNFNETEIASMRAICQESSVNVKVDLISAAELSPTKHGLRSLDELAELNELSPTRQDPQAQSPTIHPKRT